VAGRQQTYLPWGQKGQTINDHWHWDMLRSDGKPYDPKQLASYKINWITSNVYFFPEVKSPNLMPINF
jgi:hypothetical protein